MFADGGKRGVNGRKPGARGEQPGGGLGHFGRWSRPSRALAALVASRRSPRSCPRRLAAADPAKVLRVSFDTAESGFDPVRVSDNNSATVLEAIFDRLLTYDYLARPARLVPMAAEAMPEMSRQRPDLHVQAAARHPVHARPGVQGRRARADRAGLRLLVHAVPRPGEPRAVRVHARGQDPRASTRWRPRRRRAAGSTTTRSCPTSRPSTATRCACGSRGPTTTFPSSMAHTSFGAVAREVVDAYGSEIAAHPVGTGPYMLAEWTRAAKIVLVANPGFRKVVWDFQPAPGDAWDARVAAAMTGKTIPQIGRVEISSRWRSRRRAGSRSTRSSSTCSTCRRRSARRPSSPTAR